MRSRIHTIMLVLSFLLSDMAAQQPITRSEFLEEVLRANPGIRASEAITEQASARLSASSAWDPPMLKATFMDTPTTGLDPFGGSRDRRINLEQRIPFPGKKGLEEEESRWQLQRAKADNRNTVLTARTTAKILFAQAEGGTEQIRVLEEQQALLSQTLRSVESRYTVGNASQADLLRIRIELEQLKNITATLRSQVRAVLFRMNALRGREPDAAFGELVPFHVEFPAADSSLLGEMAIAHRPDLLAASAVRAGHEAARAFAVRSYWPDLNVGLGYRDNRAMGTSWELMLGISLPIAPWSSASFSGRRAEAEAGIRAADAFIMDRTLAARQETAELYDATRVRHERFRRYSEQIVPDAQQTLEVLRTSYQSGRSDFLSFIDSFRRLETLLMDMIDERVAYHTTFAQLEQAVGTDLTGLEQEDSQ